jgi:hypothetical protein
MTIVPALLEQLNQLDEAKQQQVLNFARALAQTPTQRGEPGIHLVQAPLLFDTQALDEIEAAIRQGETFT